MRVIAGSHRGRRLQGPHGTTLRPTSDRVREALFSILGNRLPDSRVLDLFAGTGAIGIEALSRGAAHVTAVESQAESLKLLRHNVAECGMNTLVTIQARTVKQFLTRPELWGGPYDIVFADPPYDLAYKLEDIFQTVHATLTPPDAWLVVEHASKSTLPDRLGLATFRKHYQYGDTALSIYSFPAEATV
ncbi:MAG: 16S rRNA (guanine(966)-N(2))-methyltransferase RsmD [Nitrospira sp.]|nr:16S rRNA (guanine(966)-N(2))-methyltransferase RsmD [Nitrospira sp.]